MTTRERNLRNPKPGDFGDMRKAGIMARRQAIKEEGDIAHYEKLMWKSWKLTNATFPLMLIGLVLIAAGIVFSIGVGDGILLWMFGGVGVALILLTTITRPLERIHAQLTDINDKLDR